MIYMFSLQTSTGINGTRTQTVKVKASLVSKQQYLIADSFVIIRIRKSLLINFITFFWSQVKLCLRLYFPPPGKLNMGHCWIRTVQNRNSRRTTISVSLFLPPVPHGLSQDWTQFHMVKCRRRPVRTLATLYSHVHVYCCITIYVLLLPQTDLPTYVPACCVAVLMLRV